MRVAFSGVGGGGAISTNTLIELAWAKGHLPKFTKLSTLKRGICVLSK